MASSNNLIASSYEPNSYSTFPLLFRPSKELAQLGIILIISDCVSDPIEYDSPLCGLIIEKLGEGFTKYSSDPESYGY